MVHRTRVGAVALAIIIASVSLLTVLPSTAIAVRPVVDTYLTGLDWPVALAVAPDGRIFFAEYLSGRIRIIEDGALLPDPFYTLTNTSTNLGQGLLGLALHPRFANDPWVYAFHTYADIPNSTTYNRVVRIRASGNTGEYHQVVFDRIPPGAYHNGGVIEFGPDETLYVLLGEALGPASSQDTGALSGKVLRMNADGSAPSSNPFWGGSAEDDYVFTYGHRNMFGIAFHPTTGRVYGTDNGPDCNDEVNLLMAGRNYGWGPSQSCSTPPPPPDNTNQDGPSPVRPIAWWGSAIAPTNAIIYGGPYFAGWQGDFIFGDWNTGSLRRLDLEAPDYERVAYEETILTVGPEGILDVQLGPDGTIWFTSPTTIYHLQDAARPPTASFTFSPSRLLVTEIAVFDGSGSSDSDGNIVSYTWDFGDGVTDIGVTAAHTYSAPGTYTVTLAVLDNESYSDQTMVSVLVQAPPAAQFTFSPTNPLATRTVTFDASESLDVDGIIVSYEWDFGDETSGAGMGVTHPYSTAGPHLATLRVRDNDGLERSQTKLVSVRALGPPIASLYLSPTFPVIGEMVTFDASPSADLDGTIVSYEWDFGDGARGAGVVVGHIYHRWGTYRATLTVIDDDGISRSASYDVAVNAPPVASFIAAPSTVYVGATVWFVASGSTDPNGAVVQFDWDFGDGTSARGTEVTHSYSSSGMFSVSLMVVDDGGSRDSVTQSITIFNRPPSIMQRSPEEPSATVAAGDVLLLTVLASDPDEQPMTYRWSVDGVEVGASATTFEFRETASGTHVVAVVISDGIDDVRVGWTVNVVPVTPAPPLAPTALFAVLAIVPPGILSLMLWRLFLRKK